MDLELLGVKPGKQKQFEKKGIHTAEELIAFLPRKYNDYSHFTGIRSPEETSIFQVRLLTVEAKIGRIPYMRAKCEEVYSNAVVYVMWFHKNYMYNKIYSMCGKIITIIGKVEHSSTYGTYTVSQPDVFEETNALGVYPIYSQIKGMSEDYLKEKIDKALYACMANSEILPDDIIKKANQISMPEALLRIHHPKNMQEAESGMGRIRFNDLTYFAIHSELNERNTTPTSKFKIKKDTLVNNIEANLPFTLTLDQRKTLDHLISFAQHGKRINALIQGDVGCGKTIVSAMIAAAMIENGFQVVIMAPTNVLAKQHYDTFSGILNPYGIKSVFLNSGMKKKEREEVLCAIKSGDIQMIVGTHACISPDVDYNNLGLTIVDEEHKFGVVQRNRIIEKGKEGVHSITMSATPIPRSLAQVIYGDGIQLETIKTMPAGRKPIITGISRDPNKTLRFLLNEVKKGHQAYVVCPMIEQSDKIEGVSSVEEINNMFRAALEPYGVRIDTLTGKDDDEYAEATIKKFQDGLCDVLISTTVIEVGVNIPNATMMIVTNAERFGLSSLHQLRGRVGRSDLQAYCVLMSDTESEKALERLQAMVDTNDGFEIAERDLQLRGAGDLIGFQQSGINRYVTLMLNNPEEYKQCKEVAKELIQRGYDCCPLMKQIYQERTNDNKTNNV